MAFDTSFPLVPLGTLVRFINGDRGTNYPGPKDYHENGIPFISATNINDGRISIPSATRISREAFNRLRSGHVKRGDLLLCIRGSLGKLGIVRDFEEGAIASSLVILRADNEIISKYLRHLLLGSVGKLLLNRLDNGSVQGNISVAALKHLHVPLPPSEALKAVAETLSCLDDRIDLLRQTNATLEAIAQALFRSWFTDFDPVRTKQAGREPKGMDAATASLFSDGFEESALGFIPKGWRVTRLAEHVEAERGLSYKGVGLCGPEEGLPMHNLNSVLEGGGYKYSGIKYYKGDWKDRHLALAGDVIVANTEQGHEHRLIGYPAIIPSRFGKAIFSHHIYRVRPIPESPLSRHTLYYMLMAPAVREQIIGCSNGSTVNMLKVVGLQLPQFVCPSAAVIDAFERVVAPLREATESNVVRSESLVELRDTLLPRLISGKLRLPEAREQMADALA